MKIIGKSSKEQAVLEWLTAEMDSARFGDSLRTAIVKQGCDEEIVTKPNLNELQENITRWQILKSYRTWIDRNFDDYDWKLIELDKVDVAELLYIEYSYWNELSDNTRKVGQAARNIDYGKVVFDVPNDNFYSVTKSIENGEDFNPIIVVSTKDSYQGEILEGHLRATGYVLSKDTPKPLMAIWGKLR